MNLLVIDKETEGMDIEKEILFVTFNSDGVMLGNTFITFADNSYDEFISILQSYGLRNLVEYTDRFTVTHQPLIEELKQLHGTHAGMTIITDEMASDRFNKGYEVYRLYTDGSEGLVQDKESIQEHLQYGGEFGYEN